MKLRMHVAYTLNIKLDIYAYMHSTKVHSHHAQDHSFDIYAYMHSTKVHSHHAHDHSFLPKCMFNMFRVYMYMLCQYHAMQVYACLYTHTHTHMHLHTCKILKFSVTSTTQTYSQLLPRDVP